MNTADLLAQLRSTGREDDAKALADAIKRHPAGGATRAG